MSVNVPQDARITCYRLNAKITETGHQKLEEKDALSSA